MTEQRSCLEYLSAEIFYLIFTYLAPHDLLRAFKKLNKRFTTILIQQPLCLPCNRHMNLKLYLRYLTKIIPKYASQFVYLHLSERRAPHALNLFISEVPLDKSTWPKLQAVTIEDVPCHLFGTLLDDNSFLSNIHSLSLDIDHDRYHHSQYEQFTDFNIVVPLLNFYPQLRSLYLRIGDRLSQNYLSLFDQHCPRINIHQNLQILTIDECSRELFIKLLNDGYLPRLRRLSVIISCAFADLGIEPPSSIPLQQAVVPELRCVSIKLYVGVTWVLNFFEDLQRHSQLERLTISGDIKSGGKDSLPRVVVLRQWLALTKLNTFTFQIKLGMYHVLNGEQCSDDLYVEYCQATGIQSTANYEQMEIYELDYVKDELIQQLEAVSCWHRLRKINLEEDFPDDNGVVGENIAHLFHIAKRSPYFRELYIESDLDFGRALSSNVELGILLSSQIEILYFKTKDADCSLKDLVRIVDKLFSHSPSTPRLKQLTLNIDGHPDSWLSTRHLIRWLGKIFKRFSKLIHFTLYCQHEKFLQDSSNNLSHLAPEWYIMSSLSRPRWISSLNYRHKPHSLDIWS
ncbi:unnamed protein product [Rotaria sp. Silwood1]|nr:unnamed protein product [Rotaria sp. Silwood1]